VIIPEIRYSTAPATVIDAWWQHRTPARPSRGGLSRHPFHELPNVLIAPHRSGLDRCYGRAALERRGAQSRPLRAWREPLDVLVRT
jgi:hypothetical protein